jgi:GcrA cell cycle regulator
MPNHCGLPLANPDSDDCREVRMPSELSGDPGASRGLSGQMQQAGELATGDGAAQGVAAQEVRKVQRRGQPKWTPEQDAALRRLRDDKVSFSVIGQTIGYTRNACIGRAHRIGLSGPPRATRPVRNLDIKPPLRFRQGNIAQRVKRRIKSVRSRPVVDFVGSSEFLGISLMDLEPGMCRFPQGAGLTATFCGQPVKPGTSWCPHCHGIVYTPRNQTVEARGWRGRFAINHKRAASRTTINGDEAA